MTRFIIKGILSFTEPVKPAKYRSFDSSIFKRPSFTNIQIFDPEAKNSSEAPQSLRLATVFFNNEQTTRLFINLSDLFQTRSFACHRRWLLSKRDKCIETDEENVLHTI